MKTWHAGDIITDARWTSLNKVYPLAKKIECVDEYSDSIIIAFNIHYDELMSLLEHGTLCWYIHPTYNDFRFIDKAGYISINSELPNITQY